MGDRGKRKVSAEDIETLREIKQDIKDLVDEARGILPDGERRAADAYWVAQILCALDNDHEYMGGSMHTLQDSIDALQEEQDEEDEEEEHQEH